MYDIILREDLINLNNGAYTVDDMEFRSTEMKKIIKCRTADKISLLNFLQTYNLIDNEYYQELLKRAESDFRKANLYLLGLCNSFMLL